jgi:hypothetical protein
LTNTGMYPFVVNMTCLTGYFVYPQAGAYAADSWRSLAEGFLWNAAGGAVAALMPTGMTDTDGQQLLSSALYEGIFALDRRRLGPAIAYAKEQLLASGGSAYEQTAQTFLLFGDPATELKVPLPHRPQHLTAVAQGDKVELSWTAAADCDGHPAAGYHVYRRLSTESTYARLTGTALTAPSYTDPISAAAAGAVYYYAATAVDGDGDESAKCEPAAVSVGEQSGSSAGGGGGGCFIDSTWEHAGSSQLADALALAAVLMCVLARRRRMRAFVRPDLPIA